MILQPFKKYRKLTFEYMNIHSYNSCYEDVLKKTRSTVFNNKICISVDEQPTSMGDISANIILVYWNVVKVYFNMRSFRENKSFHLCYEVNMASRCEAATKDLQPLYPKIVMLRKVCIEFAEDVRINCPDVGGVRKNCTLIMCTKIVPENVHLEYRTRRKQPLLYLF